MAEKTEKKRTLRELTEISFQIIVKAGEAKSLAMEGIFAAKEGDFSLAEKKHEEAEKKLVEAEKEHFELIQEEAQGVTIQVPLILMHAEDQLLSTQSIILLGNEIATLHKAIHDLKK